jgi:hypothetical protein
VKADDPGSLRIIEVAAHRVPEHGFQLLHPIRLGEDGMTQGSGLIAAFGRLLDGKMISLAGIDGPLP